MTDESAVEGSMKEGEAGPVRPLAVTQEANAQDSDPLMDALASPLGAMGTHPPGDRRPYYREYESGVHLMALKVVADFNERPIECFRCGSREIMRKIGSREKFMLHLDHVAYWKDSVRKSHGAQRSREAIRNPERFMIMCRRCHEKYDLRPGVFPERKRKAVRQKVVVIASPVVVVIRADRSLTGDAFVDGGLGSVKFAKDRGGFAPAAA